MKSAGNIPASVRQRLLNRAKIDRRPFNELFQYYAMERFLYRFSLSAYADRFVLKGALMIDNFISPIISDLSSENSNPKKWSAPGPWIEAKESNPKE